MPTFEIAMSGVSFCMDQVTSDFKPINFEKLRQEITGRYLATADGRAKLVLSTLGVVPDYLRLACEGHPLFTKGSIRAGIEEHVREIEKILACCDGTETFDRTDVNAKIESLRKAAASLS